MSPTKTPSVLSRRRFIKTAAAAAAPVIIPARVFSGSGAPSDTLTIGCIGLGRQGRSDCQEAIYRGLETGARVVAVCDVDEHRAEDAQWLVERSYAAELKRSVYRGVDTYSDYRDLLGREDIDAVLITVPDHGHALIGVAAAEAGKDIYMEKPLAFTIAEGRRLVEAVRKNKRILQTGSQQRSQIYFSTACELVRNGRIGKLSVIKVRNPTDEGTGNPVPMPVPKYFNYDVWLGPAPEAPFTVDRTHPQDSYERPGWMQIEAYDHGMISNWGAHMNDIAQWGHGSDDSGPVEIEAKGEFPDRGLFDVHTKYASEAAYADGVRLLQDSGNPAGVRFEGNKGWIFCSREKIEASDPAILRERIGPGEIRLHTSGNHMKNFLECVRSRNEPVAPVEIGHRSNTVCCLTHIAMKLGRKLRWDPAAEKFIGDEEANGRLDYPHRAPYKL